MMRSANFRRLFVLVLLLMAGLAMAASQTTASDIDYALCDVRVLYLYEYEEDIDWPTLYYLNDAVGCRIDLVNLKISTIWRQQLSQVDKAQIYAYRYFLPPDTTAMDSLVTHLLADRKPDIVLVGASRPDTLLSHLVDTLKALPGEPGELFTISRIYQITEPKDQVQSDKRVVINTRELNQRYRERIWREVPKLFSNYTPPEHVGRHLTVYRLLHSQVESTAPQATFLSGLETFRLLDNIEVTFAPGPQQRTYTKLANDFISSFKAARFAMGKARTELLVKGYKQLTQLMEPPSIGSVAGFPAPYRRYLQALFERAEHATLNAVGLNWSGTILRRDTPHGGVVKYRIAVSSNGPQPVELSEIKFHPYWDSTATLLDAHRKRIAPHQSYEKEYLVDIEPERLTARQPESLLFTAQLHYGATPVGIRSVLPIWTKPEIDVRFEPAYFFVPPVPDLDVDRMVASMNWRVMITKPSTYAGEVRLNLETPRGLFAGAYRQNVPLERGKTLEVVRIPFSISNLFELGIQHQVIRLTIDDRTVAVDTARIRIAECKVPRSVTVGFLPDSTGQLEDVLRMANVNFQPLTDRTLITGNLDVYEVIVIGSGAADNYPSLPSAKDRLETYLKHGGSLVLMGQPEDWPRNVLPVAFTPGLELADQEDIEELINPARVMSMPYRITTKGLLSHFYRQRTVSAAVIAPAERVLATPTGAALLSVSRIGDGQIIYCGLPLLDMIARLDIEAIHLFGNMLNY
ncbi:hypothetical protein GF356_07765 [candidate division GN15 bacterium]|nr:hypothetical protein [candidate division GN15 bacterium]